MTNFRGNYLTFMTSRSKLLLAFILSLSCIGCDRISKDLAREHLKGQESVHFLNKTVHLVYVENTGAFMSWGADWPANISFWILTVLPILVMGAFAYYILRNHKNLVPIQLAAWVMVFSGGMGNLIDRVLFDRHVTDFILLGVPGFQTGIFNIADLFVTSGAFLLLTHSLLSSFKKKPVEESTTPS